MNRAKPHHDSGMCYTYGMWYVSVQVPNEEPGDKGGGLRRSIHMSIHLEHCLTRQGGYSRSMRYETRPSKTAGSRLLLRADAGAIENGTTLSVSCDHPVLDF
jgi:hypothetical protein